MRSIPLGKYDLSPVATRRLSLLQGNLERDDRLDQGVLGHPLRDGAIIFGGLIRFNRMPVVALAQHAGERRHAYLEQIAAQIVAI